MDISCGVADHEPLSEPRASTRHRFRPAVVLVSVAAAVAGSILLATHNSSAKVTTRGVTATLRTPGHPGWVAAGDDALWLAVTDARRTVRTLPLLRLDPASGAVKQRVSLGGRAAYLMHLDRRLLASVEYNGSRGSGPSLIVALDWRTGRLLARSEFPGLIGPLAESGRDLWALRVRPAALLRLDRLTLAPTAAPIPLSQGRAAGLAAAAASSGQANPMPGTCCGSTGATQSVSRVHVGGFPIGVTVAGREHVVRRSQRRQSRSTRPVDASAGREGDPGRRQARVARERRAVPSASPIRREEP